jgi:hypothetical protein
MKCVFKFPPFRQDFVVFLLLYLYFVVFVHLFFILLLEIVAFFFLLFALSLSLSVSLSYSHSFPLSSLLGCTKKSISTLSLPKRYVFYFYFIFRINVKYSFFFCLTSAYDSFHFLRFMPRLIRASFLIRVSFLMHVSFVSFEPLPAQILSGVYHCKGVLVKRGFFHKNCKRVTLVLHVVRFIVSRFSLLCNK